MRKILEYLDMIDEELEDAKEYAENYLQHKAEGKIEWANKYKEMASDDLKHSANINEIVACKIEGLKCANALPYEMQEIWEKKHIKYVEKSAWIKQMLTM